MNLKIMYASWLSDNAFVFEAVGMRFESRTSQMRQSVVNGLLVATASTFLQKKLYCSGAMKRRDGPSKLVTRFGGHEYNEKIDLIE